MVTMVTSVATLHGYEVAWFKRSKRAAGEPCRGQSLRAKLIAGMMGIALLSGCATPVDPNPPVAAANTGYVDFYCESDSDLSWDVLRFEAKSGKMKAAYSKYKPLPGNVLRVTSPPGTQRFQVGIFNKANRGPIQVNVQVEAAKVTPVEITLEHLGQAAVDRKLYGFRGSAKGYLGGTKIISEQHNIVQLHADAQPAQSYQARDQMAYVKKAPAPNELTPTGR